MVGSQNSFPECIFKCFRDGDWSSVSEQFSRPSYPSILVNASRNNFPGFMSKRFDDDDWWFSGRFSYSIYGGFPGVAVAELLAQNKKVQPYTRE